MPAKEAEPEAEAAVAATAAAAAATTSPLPDRPGLSSGPWCGVHGVHGVHGTVYTACTRVHGVSLWLSWCGDGSQKRDSPRRWLQVQTRWHRGRVRAAGSLGPDAAGWGGVGGGTHAGRSSSWVHDAADAEEIDRAQRSSSTGQGK